MEIFLCFIGLAMAVFGLGELMEITARGIIAMWLGIIMCIIVIVAIVILSMHLIGV